MTFATHKAKASSEKVVLAWLEPSQRLFSWTLHSGSVYKKTVSYYVSGVRQDAVTLTSVASVAAVNGAGKWFFDTATKILYVWSTGGVNPSSVWTDVTYRLFFSNAPIDLPADLASGTEVHYEARIKNTSKFKARFDENQTGIALEGTGRISLHNGDSFFTDLYDKLIWENKTVRIFSYARDLSPSERSPLFNGVITNKSFDDSLVSFEIKDFIYKLRSKLDLPLYSSDDGTSPESLTDKPKRRVYGRVNGLVVGPVDNMQSAYGLRTIDGDDLRTATPITVSMLTGSNVVTVSHADVHKELCAGDTLIVSDTRFKIKSLARVDIGLDQERTITVSRTSDFVARLAFTGISTSGVTAGDHITLSTLSNASQDTKSKIIGHFPIAVVNAAYLEFTLPTSIASLSDSFKSNSGEIAVTRQSNSTTLTLQQVSPFTVTDAAATVEPAVPYRRFNRRYSVAHHALSTKQTTIVGVISAIKFVVDDPTDIYVGDVIRLDGDQLTTVEGVETETGNVTVLDVILPLPTIGMTVDRLGVQRVTYKEKDFTQFEDFEPDYDTSLGSRLIFSTLAEFNAALPEALPSRARWLNGSKQVLGANNVFRGLRARDWVSSDTDGVWYEIAEKFSDNLIILTTPYTGTTGENATTYKTPTYLEDASKVIAEVYGKTVDGTEAGEHISTAAQIVADVMDEAGLGDLINAESFDAAAEAASYLVSYCIPQEPGGSVPTIRDVVNRVNESVFGSLYSNLEGEVLYKVLDASRSLADATLLDDSDVVGYSVATNSTSILRKVLIRFAERDADTVTEEPTYSVEQAESAFVLNSGIDGQVETVETVLFNRSDATIMAQRRVFVSELARSSVTLRVKLQLAEAVLNDLVTVDLTRLFKRLGTSGTDKTKTGLINAIDKDGLTVQVKIDDLGNIFNRVAVITGNSEPEYADASESEKRFAGYICDDDGLADGDESTFNANLIG